MKNTSLLLGFLFISQEVNGLSTSFLPNRISQRLPFYASTTDEVIETTNKVNNEAEQVFYETLDKVDSQHEKSSFQSSLASEDIDRNDTPIPRYEPLYGNDAYNNKPIAYRSIGSNEEDKILSNDAMQSIKSSADKYWNENKEAQEDSRFTLQFKGNSEIHLDDLCSYNPSIKPLLNSVLKEKVYPLLRKAFHSQEYQLCIYDALYVRYDADKALEYYVNVTGASQPLHRDLGLYSVNIALNNDFEGGGTFFENAIEKNAILKPVAPGHCLIHNSWERHAGVPTTKGIRDIIVLFVSSRQYPNQGAPIMERFARVKGMLRPLPVSQRIYTMNKLIHMAKELHVEEISYGEAFLWLGFDLMQKHEYEVQEYSMEEKVIQRYRDMNDAIDAFTKGTELLPNDARGYFHLASASDMRLKYVQQYIDLINDTTPLDLQTEVEGIISKYEKCIHLERIYTTSGLKQGDDWMEACVRLGTVYASYGNFVSALETFEGILELHHENRFNVPSHILDEARRAIEFCKGRIHL